MRLFLAQNVLLKQKKMYDTVLLLVYSGSWNFEVC